MIRIALIGCGSHSEREHATPLKRYVEAHPGEIELAAACDLDASRAGRFCEKYGFQRGYSDLGKLLEKETPDACVAILPVGKIFEMSRHLLQAKIPCVIEKPPGATLQEARQLMEVAAQTGTPHMVSVNRRFIPLLNRAIEWARQQGCVRHIHARVMREKRKEPEFIWGTGIHSVDAMRHIGGEVEHYEWKLHGNPGAGTKWFDIFFRFRNGCTGRLDILPTSGRTLEEYEIIGEGFTVSFACHLWKEARLMGWKQDQLVLDQASSPDEAPDLMAGAYGEVEEFVRALKQGVPPRPTLADVFPSLEICFAIHAQVMK